MYPGPHQTSLKLIIRHPSLLPYLQLQKLLDDDDDDEEEEEELPEISSNYNEAVGIWADDPNRYLPVEWRLTMKSGTNLF